MIILLAEIHRQAWGGDGVGGPAAAMAAIQTAVAATFPGPGLTSTTARRTPCGQRSRTARSLRPGAGVRGPGRWRRHLIADRVLDR
jgi:hypothetical protein